MTFPIRNLKDAENRLAQYQMEERPLNIEESRELRDLLTNLRVSFGTISRHLRVQRLPPDVSLAFSNLKSVIG